MAIVAFMLFTVAVHAIDNIPPVSPFSNPDILTSKYPLDVVDEAGLSGIQYVESIYFLAAS